MVSLHRAAIVPTQVKWLLFLPVRPVWLL